MGAEPRRELRFGAARVTILITAVAAEVLSLFSVEFFFLGATTSSALRYYGTIVLSGLAVEFWSRRTLHRIREETYKTRLESLGEEDFERFDNIAKIREDKARADFLRNVSDAFLVTELRLQDVDFFDSCIWTLRPGVNVLLGRNGYGKSLILRALAALLQRNEKSSNDLFAHASDVAFLELSVEREGVPETIRRNGSRFTESPGKIPILAMPDSRFVNRMETSIDAPKEGSMDLRSEGARHFLEGRPYGEMIDLLFNELCFDYLEGDSFDQPVFGLLEHAIQELTGDRFEFHSVERTGRNSFRLSVVTEGNPQPVPIQYASQGTVSVLGVMGIVRTYLQELFPGVRHEELLHRPAIVLIDELDAHLHPLWQQKVSGLLRETFPNVQFILTAHSPLMVAGCWAGEVAVLRNGKKGLYVQNLDRNFVGTPVEEIYEVIFKVENVDDAYLRSATRATSGFTNQKRISELEAKGSPTELERRELQRLVREEGMIQRAAEVSVERTDDAERIFELEAQVEALEDQLRDLRQS